MLCDFEDVKYGDGYALLAALEDALSRLSHSSLQYARLGGR